MGFGQLFGKILFIAFLAVRGVQHIQQPDDWVTQFNQRYQNFYKSHSNHAFVKENVPSNLLEPISPQNVIPLVAQYGKYFGYVEAQTAVSILLGVPVLPVIGATLILIETIVFYSPLNANVNLANEIYYFIVYLAIAGLTFMMAFAPPTARVPEEKKQSKNAMSKQAAARVEKNGKEPQFAKKANKAGKRN